MGCGASANAAPNGGDGQKTSPATENAADAGNLLPGPQARLPKPLQVDTRNNQITLKKVAESVADVVPGPEEKGISGIRDTEFRPVLEHYQTSGISHELEATINSISHSVFGLPFSVSIAIPSITDTPLIGISDGFCELSGYTREEIVGQNCRFLLKGVPKDEVSDDVRQEARRYCRAAHLRNLTSLAHTWLLQRNARKNGELFWNYFMLTMVPGPDKRTYIIGLQLDLGPVLETAHNIKPGMPMPTHDVVEGHRKNLEMVRGLMFGVGQNPREPLNGVSTDMSQVADAFLRLSDDITGWLQHAEMSSDAFQKWGTKPWVAWPDSSKHALLNGGTTLLRLEADSIEGGAIGMSIFPADKKANSRSFKVRVDEVCMKYETDVMKQAKLPIMGLTTVSPAAMDAQGGLPHDLTQTPSSILFLPNGSVQVSADLRAVDETEAWFSAPSCPEFRYQMAAEDTLECIWGKGLFKLEANGEELIQVRDPAIVAPPKKAVFGIIDICWAVCRVTLIA